MYTNWLTLSGNTTVEIIQKKATELSIKSGCIVVADKEIVTTLNEKNELKGMNQVSGIFFLLVLMQTILPFNVVLLKARNQLLSLKEYKCCLGASPMGMIKIPSGKIHNILYKFLTMIMQTVYTLHRVLVIIRWYFIPLE